MDQNALLLDDHNCIKYFNVQELGIKYVAIKELDNYRRRKLEDDVDDSRKNQTMDKQQALEYDESVNMSENST